MADQSIALQAKAPDIDVMAPLLAFQRLQMGEESLLQNRQARQQTGNENDAQLMRQAIAEAGDDPDAWTAAMDKAAQRGSTTAAQNRQYSPLAAQRLARAYGGQGGPLMAGGRAQEGGGQGGGGSQAPDISQDQGFIQKWSGLKPDQRANLLRGFARAAQLLPAVRDQASMDRMVDTLKAEGHPEAENLRGQYSPMAVQSLHNRIQQMMQFGGEQGARGMTGAEYRAPTEDLKVGEDIVQHDLGTGGYTQKYHAQPTTADDWQYIGTDENGKPISQNRRSGEYKTGDSKISAKPRAPFTGATDSKFQLLVDNGYSRADAARIVAGQGGLTPQRALELGLKQAAQETFGYPQEPAKTNARAKEIADQLMGASPITPTAAAPASVPNPVAPARPAAAAPPPNLRQQYATPEAALKAHPELRDAYDRKHGEHASDKILGPRKPAAVGPQSSLEQNRTGVGEGAEAGQGTGGGGFDPNTLAGLPPEAQRALAPYRGNPALLAEKAQELDPHGRWRGVTTADPDAMPPMRPPAAPLMQPNTRAADPTSAAAPDGFGDITAEHFAQMTPDQQQEVVDALNAHTELDTSDIETDRRANVATSADQRRGFNRTWAQADQAGTDVENRARVADARSTGIPALTIEGLTQILQLLSESNRRRLRQRPPGQRPFSGGGAYKLQ
jgi:hypothetical protein